MNISWKNENEGGSILDKSILIEHSPLYLEETSINKINREIERQTKTKAAAEEALRIANLKLETVTDELDIEL